MAQTPITGNEPAMPFIETGEPNTSTNSGLTIRQHFAAMAMQGLLAAWGQHDVTDMADFANDAVMAADALIAQLNK